jgi:transposase InsO family protein
MSLLGIFGVMLDLLLKERKELLLENLALRHQLAVYRRTTRRPKVASADRLLWVWLARHWSGWKSALHIVSPATVVRWHREGFRRYWRRRSRGKPGRPRVSADIRALIRRMSKDNTLWGVPRIQAELKLLGHDVARSTVAKYLVPRPKSPSPTWKAFLNNHVDCLASIDFFVVPTVTFQVLYCFVVLRHDRRRVVHFNVTARPTPTWVAAQVRQAFPAGQAPRLLLRDRDGAYRPCVQHALKDLGIQEVITAPSSPWQNPFVERLIGTLRRECLDHVIVFNEAHLTRLLRQFFDYYHNSRTHQALDDNAPNLRAIDPPERGKVIAIPQVGGLHHRYRRVG